MAEAMFLDSLVMARTSRTRPLEDRTGTNTGCLEQVVRHNNWITNTQFEALTQPMSIGCQGDRTLEM